MDKNSVTRAFSFGAVGSGTDTLDLSAARRHSSAGIRALLWATSSAKSFGCSADSQTSFENIFPNILTPSSIPQFTIPTLSVRSGSRSHEKGTEEDGLVGISGNGRESSVSLASATSSSSSSSSPLNLVPSERRAERSVSDPLARGKPLLHRDVSYHRSFREDQQCLDPMSKAALSLPHLTKVTTPYGFVTLSQSPQMASEEALLHQAGLRCSKKDKVNKTLQKATENGKGKSSHLSEAKKELPREAGDSQAKARVVQEDLKTSSASFGNSSQRSIPKQTEAKRKRRFYEVIRKYFITHHLK